MEWDFKVGANRGVARLSASWMNLYNFVGHVGKEKLPSSSLFSYASLLFMAFLIAGCSGNDAAMMLQSGRVIGLGGMDGRWQGVVHPIKPNCGTDTVGLMTIGKGSFGFAPFQNTVALKGEVGDGDILTGTLERLGGDKRTVGINMHARLSDDRDIVGNLMSGRCEWTFKLTRG